MELFENKHNQLIFYKKKLRWICTVGSNITKNKIIEMIKNGMNVIRVHMAYQNKLFLKKIVDLRNEVENEYNLLIPIIVDLKGIGIRIGEFKNSKVFLEKGKTFRFFNKRNYLGNSSFVCCDFGDYINDIELNDEILLCHGKFTLKVIKKETLEEGLEAINKMNDYSKKNIFDEDNNDPFSYSYTIKSIQNLELINVIVCEIMEDCIIKSHYPIFLSLKKYDTIISKTIKTINEPICNKDIIFIDQCKILNIDYIAVSNVTDKKELEYIKKNLLYDSNIKLLSKIQEKKGILNLDEILKLSDGIIICRNYWINYLNEISNYFLLNQIYEKCSRLKKLILIMGHIMESLLCSNIPNCNEINDLISLSQKSIDGIILTRETMYSDHTIEVVNKTSKIIYESEIINKKMSNEISFSINNEESKYDINIVKNGLSKLVKLAIKNFNSPYIIVLTQTGDTAFYLSKQNLDSSILSICNDKSVARFCNTLKGNSSIWIKNFENNFEKNILEGIRFLYKKELLSNKDYIIFIYGTIQGITNSSDSLKIINIGEFLEKYNIY